MTPEELKHAAEVMTAAANGATIEQAFYYDTGQGPWCVEDDPAWDWNTYNYRVKRTPIELAIQIGRGNDELFHSIMMVMYNPDEVRRRIAAGETITLKFREVTDGS